MLYIRNGNDLIRKENDLPYKYSQKYICRKFKTIISNATGKLTGYLINRRKCDWKLVRYGTVRYENICINRSFVFLIYIIEI